MPKKKWLIQYCIAFPLICAFLSLVQYAKGKPLEYAIEFGLLWAAISLLVFAVRRAYNFHKSIDCALCNDLSARKASQNNSSDSDTLNN